MQQRINELEVELAQTKTELQKLQQAHEFFDKDDIFKFYFFLDELDRCAVESFTTSQFHAKVAKVLEFFWRSGWEKPGLQTLAILHHRMARESEDQDLLSTLSKEGKIYDRA